MGESALITFSDAAGAEHRGCRPAGGESDRDSGRVACRIDSCTRPGATAAIHRAPASCSRLMGFALITRSLVLPCWRSLCSRPWRSAARPDSSLAHCFFMPAGGVPHHAARRQIGQFDRCCNQLCVHCRRHNQPALPRRYPRRDHRRYRPWPVRRWLALYRMRGQAQPTTIHLRWG